MSAATRLLIACALTLALGSGAAGVVGAQSHDSDDPKVLVAPMEGAIDPVTVEVVQRCMTRAREGDYSAVVFEMDTPGGLMTSMDSTVKEFLNEKKIPIIVYVSPKGATAASAGAFILMASDVAAMAPSTNVGSATPIQGSGQDVEGDIGKKVKNHAIARIRELAEDNGRNADWAEDAVRDADNIGAREALKIDVIEFVADDVEDLLEQADGFTTTSKDLTLDTAGANIDRCGTPWHLKVLKKIIDPNLLFLLFSLGLLGIAFEVTHPGTIAPGVVGVISLVLALFGFQVLPINWAGALLLLLAIVLFVLEAFIPSGVLGTGGVISLVLGGLLLFDRESGLSVDLPLLIVVALLFAGFFGILVKKAIEARRHPVTTGYRGMLGNRGVVRQALAPTGQVFVHGELWRAVATSGEHLPVGTEIVIDQVDGLTLHVSRVDAEAIDNTEATTTDSPTESEET